MARLYRQIEDTGVRPLRSGGGGGGPALPLGPLNLAPQLPQRPPSPPPEAPPPSDPWMAPGGVFPGAMIAEPVQGVMRTQTQPGIDMLEPLGIPLQPTRVVDPGAPVRILGEAMMGTPRVPSIRLGEGIESPAMHGAAARAGSFETRAFRDDERQQRRAARGAPPQSSSGPTIVGTPPCTKQVLEDCLKIAVAFYGNAIDWSQVRIDYESGLAPVGRAYVTGSTIHVDPRTRCEDLCAFLIHELAHVMGNQRGEHVSAGAGITHLLGGGTGLYQIPEQDLIDEANSDRPCAFEFGKEKQAQILQLYHDCMKNPAPPYTIFDSQTGVPTRSKGARHDCPQLKAAQDALEKFALQLLDPVKNPCPPLRRRATGR